MSTITNLVSDLSPVLIDDVKHLRLDDVVEAVALHLFPTGPSTEEEMNEAVSKAKKALAELRYTPAGYLKPPQVPFSKRGEYYKGLPEITQDAVKHFLEDRKMPSWDEPIYEAPQDTVARYLCRYAFGCGWESLDKETQEQILLDISIHAKALGWTFKDGRLWTKPMTIDEDAAKKAINDFLSKCQGPVYIPNLHADVLRAAYGRTYYNLDPLPDPIQRWIHNGLELHHYKTEPDGEFYDPIMPHLPDDAEEKLITLFQDLTVYKSDQYELSGLLFDHVQKAVSSIASFPLTEWMTKELAKNGPIGRALMRLGYETSPFNLDTTDMQPDDDHLNKTIMPFFRREQHFSVLKKDAPSLALATGMRVRTPVIVLDDAEETIIALQMLGPEQSVKANWAALMGGGKRHWINACKVKLSGSKSHITLKQSLQCGWTEMWLIHKQASAVEISPEQPFYVLDDATAVPPQNFFLMLDRALELPLQSAWARDLWLIGRQEKLITPATDSSSTGRGAWTVTPAMEPWSDIISTGLKNGRFTF